MRTQKEAVMALRFGGQAPWCLMAALALPAASGLFLAILVPLWFFGALAASLLVRVAPDSPAAPRSPFLAPAASRAPPVF